MDKSSEDDTVDPMPFPDDANPDVLEMLTTIRKKLRSSISTNIHSAQEHQKRAFDLRHNSNKEITPGSISPLIHYRVSALRAGSFAHHTSLIQT